MRINNHDNKLEVLTEIGRVQIKRDYYFCRYCSKGGSPLDVELKLFGDHKVTMRMADLLTYSGQVAMSFEKASELMFKYTGMEIGESLIRTVTEETGEKVFQHDMKNAEQTYRNPEKTIPFVLPKDKKDGVLYIMMDGSSVNTIQKDECGSSWREMKLGLIFADYDRIKTKDGKVILTQKEYVTYFGEVGAFKKLIFDATARSGYGRIKEVVVIGDGAHWIWNMCEEIFPEAVEILDYYHLSENVHKFGRYLHPDNDIEMKKWSKDILDKVDSGKVEQIIDELPDLEGVTLPDHVPNLKKYIKNNKKRVEYPDYKKKGYYIGSGAIESGNKMVIQQRMKQSGMRWSLSGGQQIAALRAKYCSNNWVTIQKAIGL